jgi:hypothetical protein
MWWQLLGVLGDISVLSCFVMLATYPHPFLRWLSGIQRERARAGSRWVSAANYESARARLSCRIVGCIGTVFIGVALIVRAVGS